MVGEQPVSWPMVRRVWELQLPHPSHKLVMLSLADHLNSKTARCDPAVSRIATRTGLSERTVRSAIDELERAGHVTQIARPGKTTWYGLHPCNGCTPTPAATAPLQSLPEPLQQLQDTPAATAPKPLGTQNEPARTRAGAPAPPSAALSEDDRRELAADMARLREDLSAFGSGRSDDERRSA